MAGIQVPSQSRKRAEEKESFLIKASVMSLILRKKIREVKGASPEERSEPKLGGSIVCDHHRQLWEGKKVKNRGG